ncbi:CsbD-like protein [Stackebrandtia albiflava]|uniref:CsbD-like protein n=1 Tax=Stackebrandtia albiflava TaxID=406432 RepID=A0A562VCP5_9ACTN|nr:CsbD family protein [Stackebrandtia albiflava]TWJ15649.1 CsbD-like protein [Stackebrandtia albiflava]
MSEKQDKLIGKAKEMAGKLTGNEKLEAEGKTQNAKGTVKDKADEVKRSVEGTVKGLRDDKRDNPMDR